MITKTFFNHVNKRGPYPSKESVRIWPKIFGTRCHEWTGALLHNGYGHFKKNGRAHRVAYEIKYGVGSLGKRKCLHKCDNKKCVRWLHLYKGTVQDNVDDMCLKKRQHHKPWSSVPKFTRLQARCIRSLYALGDMNYAQLAKRYDVSPIVISRIVRRLSYCD